MEASLSGTARESAALELSLSEARAERGKAEARATDAEREAMDARYGREAAERALDATRQALAAERSARTEAEERAGAARRRAEDLVLELGSAQADAAALRKLNVELTAALRASAEDPRAQDKAVGLATAWRTRAEEAEGSLLDMRRQLAELEARASGEHRRLEADLAREVARGEIYREKLAVTQRLQTTASQASSSRERELLAQHRQLQQRMEDALQNAAEERESLLRRQDESIRAEVGRCSFVVLFCCLIPVLGCCCCFAVFTVRFARTCICVQMRSVVERLAEVERREAVGRAGRERLEVALRVREQKISYLQAALEVERRDHRAEVERLRQAPTTRSATVLQPHAQAYTANPLPLASAALAPIPAPQQQQHPPDASARDFAAEAQLLAQRHWELSRAAHTQFTPGIAGRHSGEMSGEWCPVLSSVWTNLKLFFFNDEMPLSICVFWMAS